MLSTEAEILLGLVIQNEKRESGSVMPLIDRAGPFLKKAKEQLSTTQTQCQNKTVVRKKKKVANSLMQSSRFNVI